MDKVQIKRKLRHLKKEEIRIRAKGVQVADDQWVFNRFFDLKDACGEDAGYSMTILMVMDHETRKSIFDDFFLEVYVTWLRDNHLSLQSLYNPKILKRLGLPFDAREQDIKKRFRHLVKKAHPDAGGDTESFLWLKDQYDQLLGDD